MHQTALELSDNAPLVMRWRYTDKKTGTHTLVSDERRGCLFLATFGVVEGSPSLGIIAVSITLISGMAVCAAVGILLLFAQSLVGRVAPVVQAAWLCVGPVHVFTS